MWRCSSSSSSWSSFRVSHLIPASYEVLDIDDRIDNFFAPFLVTFIIVFGMIATGVVIRIFFLFDVSYTFIFEANAVKRIREYSFFRIGMVSGSVWILTFSLQFLIVKFTQPSYVNHIGVFALINFLFFVGAPLLPIKRMWHRERMEMA